MSLKLCDKIKLNSLLSCISGTLFFTGWWLMIDVNSNYNDVIYNSKIYYLPGIAATISLIIINYIPNDLTNGSYFYSDVISCHPFYAVILLFLGFTIGFGSLIGATYILINDFLLKPEIYQWPGIGIFLQNVLIFASGMIMKFSVKHDSF